MKGNYYVDIIAEPLKIRYSWITAIVYCALSFFPGLFTKLFSETETVKIFDWSIGFSIFATLFNIDLFRSHFNRKNTDEAFVIVSQIQCILIAVIYLLCIFFVYSLRKLFVQLYKQEEKGFTDLESLSLIRNQQKEQKFRPVTHSKLAKYSATVAPQLSGVEIGENDKSMNHLPINKNIKKKPPLLNRPKPPPIQISHLNTKPSYSIFSSRYDNVLESSRSLLLNREESNASALPLFAPISPLTRESTAVFNNNNYYYYGGGGGSSSNNVHYMNSSTSFTDSPKNNRNGNDENNMLYNSYKRTPFITTNHKTTPIYKSALKYKKTGLSKVKYSVVNDSDNEN